MESNVKFSRLDGRRRNQVCYGLGHLVGAIDPGKEVIRSGSEALKHGETVVKLRDRADL